MKIFVCFTPLHVLISKKIIEIKNIKKYIFIYMCDVDNKKNRFYYNKLSQNAVCSYFIILKKNFIEDFKIIYSLSKKIKKYKNLIFYTGNIKSMHIRFLMYLSKYKKYITFDDGLGNISGDGYFYDSNEKIASKIFFTLFDRKLLYKNILKDDHLHYTIFKQENVYKNTIFINLFDNKNNFNTNKNNKMVVLLTSVFSEDGEMPLNNEEKLYEKIIKEFNVTHFIKHPRQKKDKIYDKAVKELKSDKIAEELLIELSYSYNLVVIGIYSTVLINLSNIKDIKLININAKVKKPVDKLLEIFNKLKIECRKI